VKRKISSLALMFLSMALTLHLTDNALRHAQESTPTANTPVAERCSDYSNVWALPNGGIGALVECEPNGIRLVTSLPGHAGELSGLRLGDRIVAIDGESTAGCNEPWAVSKLRGKIGTTVVLDVERGEGLTQRCFRTELERRHIKTQYSVYSRLRDSELTIRVLWMGSETPAQLAEHLAQVNQNKVDNVILDLTNLSHGDVQSLKECASMFLPEGTLIGHYSQLLPGQESQMNELYTQGNQFTDQITTLKIGPYTAKYGEVLARALSDNLDLEVTGQATAGLGTLDHRTIRSRGARGDYGMELFDAQGDRIDGNPLEPDFWSWSNLLAPVRAGLD
jgi:carboxyl-terminal processing protease